MKTGRFQPVVEALQALRGVQCTVAVSTVAAKATRLHAWRQGTPRRLEVTRPSTLYLCLAIRSRSCLPRRSSPTAGRCGPSPEPGSHGTTRCVAPALGRGREEGTEKVLGRSARTDHALPLAPRRREHRKTCVVQPRTVCAVIRQSSPHTRPSADCARNLRRKKSKKSALRTSVSLDKRKPHTCYTVASDPLLDTRRCHWYGT